MNGSCRPTPRDVITIGAHSAEEILEALKREFAMERLAFEELNPVTRGGFQREKEFQQKNGLPVTGLGKHMLLPAFPGSKQPAVLPLPGTQVSNGTGGFVCIP